ncbi:glucose 1-dehydrogenase [Bacillaceae bacterium SIJ1]|uniref:glucose 1-dehydrogenase n=1 Tax=Litoribacterium kuwaitense TaxID=1398745 RepID=UPI0013EC8382|nr:glucose 1-dehydrogenase [Litoribacterium kuwaitense]NGP43996.1 glucose 1-dehydrogenase [Litoribacterium kuwaitense]
MSRLEGKVVVITGAASGMGATHARRLSTEGAKLVITDILEKEGQALAEELGEHVKFIKHDVTKEADWQNVVDQTEKEFGPIDVLVNNAGIAITKSIEEITEEEYRKVVDINQVSVFLGMKTVVSSMRKTESGSIVNISSLGGLIGQPGIIAYNASKFAVRGMTKVAAMEFAEYNIRVNSVHPGIIQTPMIEGEGQAELRDQLVQAIPLKRIASSEEVSNLVLYLASDESSYSTGSEFVVDGGMFAQ